MTPGLEITQGRVAAGNPAGQAVDLSEIRRSEELIDVLAAGAAAARPLPRDRALMLLRALVADVDTPDAVRGGHPRQRSGAGTAAGAGPDGRPAADPSARPAAAASDWLPSARPAAAAGGPMSDREVAMRAASGGVAAWLRAAVSGAVVAGLAGTTSVVATSMLARLSRDPASPGRSAGRGSAASRPRRPGEWPQGNRARRGR